MYESDSEAEMISDNSDLDLEPGEIPSTKSRGYSGTSERGRGTSYRHYTPRQSAIANTDDYGSSSDDGIDYGSDSDESMDWKS